MNSSPWIAFLLFSSFASATPWNPDNYPRNVTHLIAKRVVVDRASRVSRLAKRQTLQPGQPIRKVSDEFIGGFQEVGHSGVSAQQLFLGTDTKVYIVDKVQNNPVSVNGHPAWATEYDLLTDTTRPLDVVTNSFCAGGGVLGDGRWLNVGGNQAVNRGGSDAPEDNQMGNNDYNNYPGGYSTRVLTPGDGSEWEDGTEDDMSSRRWYPTLETVEDGRIIIIGGNQRGGFVNNIENNNPTYEYYPKAEGETPVALNILLETLPANLFPITYLIPTGLLLMNINKNAIMFDYKNNEELPLPSVPFAVRTYPASAATWMLPMKVKDSWLATAYYCGGSDLQPEQWTAGLILITTPAHQSCIKISPEVSDNFESDDDLPIGRVMASAIVLPDGKVLLVNGANTGVAGYGLEPWTNGDSYADNPVQNPLLFDSTKPPGQRWSGDGLKDSPIPRMYHSSATLLPDGSVFVAGSSPHPDVVTDNTAYRTEYRVEIFYPPYFNKRRPEPRGIPAEIGYGGSYFDLELTNEDLQGNVGNVKTISILLMKTGFSTHGINFGQRAAELDYTYTAKEDGSATLHVSQAPPNPAIMPPGPAWFFVTVNGVPSVGVQVMVGNGQIGAQEMSEPEALPENSEVDETPDDSSDEDGDSSASRVYVANSVAAASIVALALAMFS